MPDATPASALQPPGQLLWLTGVGIARVGFTMIYTIYAAMLPLLTQDWQMSAGQAGLIQSAFHLGFLTSLVSVGFLGDRFGQKRIYLLSTFGALGSAVLFAAFARDFYSGLLLYGLVGVLSGGSYTPMIALIAQRVDARTRGWAIGYYLSASQLGYAATLFISSEVLPLGGWRLAFACAAVGPVFGALLGAWMVRKVPNAIPEKPKDARQVGLMGLLRNKAAMLCILAYTFHSWEILGLWAWIPYFLAASYDPGAAVSIKATSVGSVFVGLTYLVSFFGPILGGGLSDRYGRTAIMLLMGGISALCSLVFGWMIVLPFAAVVAVGFVYQLTAIGDSPVYSTAITELVPERYVGAAYSLRSLLGFGAGAIASPVFGLVLDWGRSGQGSPLLGWGLGFLTLGVGGVLSVLCSLWLRLIPEAEAMAAGKR